MPVQVYTEIKGHPTAELESVVDRSKVLITLCAECGGMKTILFLDKDRWFCTRCKNDGAKSPTVIPISNPRRKK
jgi:ribosomal protein S27AE